MWVGDMATYVFTSSNEALRCA